MTDQELYEAYEDRYYENEREYAEQLLELDNEAIGE